MNRKKELLQNIRIFKALTAEEFEILSELCGFKNYSPGEIIFEEGDGSRHCYIVDSGEVRIVKMQKDQEGDIIAHFIKGEIFGELDLFEDDLHTAHAVSAEESRLLSIPDDVHQFDVIYKQYPHIFAKVYHNLVTFNAARIRHANKLVTEKNQWFEELRRKMLFDKLTGLYNKSYLEDELIKKLPRLGSPLSLLVVKPDDFKSVNDNFGHEAGDTALIAIAKTVKDLLKKNELPIRFRGNEFVLLFPFTNPKTALERAKKIQTTLNDLDIGKIIKDISFKLNFSIGIAVYPDHTTDGKELVEKAYAKLFEQRNDGGNGILMAREVEEERVRLLKSIDIFSGLYLNELNTISEFLIPINFHTGETICEEGELGDVLYIMEEGAAAISIRLPDGMQKDIAEIASGDFFGEMAIFENAPRSATCIASTDCRILKLNKSDFFNLMNLEPGMTIRIMQSMLNITSGRLQTTSQFLSEMVRWGNEASRRAITDDLTGIYNRRFLDSSLEEHFQKAMQENTPLSLIMADLDYFREVNEGYSHDVGDKYIIQVANIFKKCLRETDIIARYGGDEFTMILPETTIPEAVALAEKIRIAVENLDFLDSYEGPDIKVSTSQGISACPEHCSDPDTLKKLADQALYKAKESGRNCVVCAGGK